MAFSKLGNGLPDFLVRLFGEQHRDFVEISLHWKFITGIYLANYSKVAKFEQGTLFIAVENSVVMQELILIKDILKKKVKDSLDISLKDIVFYITDEKRKSKNSTVNSVGRFR